MFMVLLYALAQVAAVMISIFRNSVRLVFVDRTICLLSFWCECKIFNIIKKNLPTYRGYPLIEDSDTSESSDSSKSVTQTDGKAKTAINQRNPPRNGISMFIG